MAFRQRRLLSTRGTLVAGGALALAVAFVPVSAQQAERVDLHAIYQIKDEGFQRSRVMEIMSWLTDVYGPRLTNSPGFRKAGDWTVKELTSWGLVNVKLQPFGPFGRGWANDKFSMMATTPGGSLPVIGYPQAWTSSTNGVVSGDAVLATIDTPEDLATWKGKLKGKVLLATAMQAAGGQVGGGDNKPGFIRRLGQCRVSDLTKNHAMCRPLDSDEQLLVREMGYDVK